MSENSFKSKPPMSEEIKERKENLSKGVKTNATNSSGNPKFSKSKINPDNLTVSDSSGKTSNPFTQNLENKDKFTFTIPKKTKTLYSSDE